MKNFLNDKFLSINKILTLLTKVDYLKLKIIKKNCH